MKKTFKPAALALAALFLVAPAAHAAPVVDVQQPWVRATVAEQKTTGAYMTLVSAQGGTLVGATSPVASAVEMHEMKMDGDIMRMRALDTLPLPAGQKVEFKPSAYHFMLLGLKHGVKAGDVIPLSLTVKDAAGKAQTVEVRAAVR